MSKKREYTEEELKLLDQLLRKKELEKEKSLKNIATKKFIEDTFGKEPTSKRFDKTYLGDVIFPSNIKFAEEIGIFTDKNGKFRALEKTGWNKYGTLDNEESITLYNNISKRRKFYVRDKKGPKKQNEEYLHKKIIDGTEENAEFISQLLYDSGIETETVKHKGVSDHNEGKINNIQSKDKLIKISIPWARKELNISVYNKNEYKLLYLELQTEFITDDILIESSRMITKIYKDIKKG